MLIPAAALATRSEGPRLAVCSIDERRVHYRNVQLGRDFGTETEVVAGLEPDEVVIVHPGDDLRDGIEIEPIDLPTK